MNAADRYRKTKSNWMRPSVNPMNQQPIRSMNALVTDTNRDYHPRAPWEQVDEELIDEFERNLNYLDVNTKHIWEEDSTELQRVQKQKEQAKEYKFESMFEPPPLSEKKKLQIENYQYNPPFHSGFNGVKEEKKPAKKMDYGYRNIKTRDPWSIGNLPADQNTNKKIFERPKTAIWEVPKGDQSGNSPSMVSSGDPVLDNLRAQLIAKGASGIAGLSRKFRIMDDDGNKVLNMHEFRKGIKESGLVELSDKAIGHLFRYFGNYIQFNLQQKSPMKFLNYDL